MDFAVYPGRKGPHSENDAAAPCNQYGKTKLQGEKAATQLPGALVLRTNIFGWNIRDKKCLAEWVISELQAGHQINGFTDAIFSTIYNFEFAAIIKAAVQKNISGIYNCGSSDSCSKYDFVVKLAEKFGYEKSLISPVSIDTWNFKAPRGKNFSLDVSKIEHALGFTMPTLQTSIESFWRDLQKMAS